MQAGGYRAARLAFREGAIVSFEFIQLADPQFGLRGRFAEAGERLLPMLRGDGGMLDASDPDPVLPDPDEDGIAREVRQVEEAFAEAAHRDAAFVVVCGDMVNNIDQPAQLEGMRTAQRTLRDDIPIYWVAGNHDLALDWSNGPTPEGLDWYREAFGEHYYGFRVEDAYFLVLNSELLADPSHAPKEGARHLEFVQDALGSEEARTAAQRVAFMHRPPFVRSADYTHAQLVPLPARDQLLKVFQEHDVRTVMAGHWHRELEARHEDLDVIVTTSIGFAFTGPTGFRSVEIDGERLSHEFHVVAG